MNQNTKYIFYAVAGLVVVGLAWYFFGSIGSAIATILGLGTARQQLRSYVEAEAQAEAAKDRAQAEHAKATAEIEAEHTKEIKRIAEQHKAKTAETNAKVDAAKTADELDDVIDDAVDDLEKVIGRPIDTINREGFVVGGLIQWLLLISLLIALCCRVGYASPSQPIAKHKAQVKRLLGALQAAKTTILRERAEHKRLTESLHANYRKELSIWRADLKSCQTKKRILAKPQPTWPRDVGFGAVGFLGGAGLCLIGGAILLGTGKMQVMP